jgi:hypothetical protein
VTDLGGASRTIPLAADKEHQTMTTPETVLAQVPLFATLSKKELAKLTQPADQPSGRPLEGEDGQCERGDGGELRREDERHGRSVRGPA